MPYGVKRGYKAPGEFGVMDIAGLALSGSAGIVAALVTDYQQSAETSALFTLNRWAVSLGSMVGMSEIPLLAVVLGLVGVGAASVFYFQPITRQGAFAQGFGLLAVLMTAIPSDLSGGIEDIFSDDDLPGLSASSSVSAGSVSAISYDPSTSLLAPSDIDAGQIINAALATDHPGWSGAGGSVSAIFYDPSTSLLTPADIDAGHIINAALPVSGTPPGSGFVPVASLALVQGERRAAQYRVRLVINFEDGLGGDLNSLIRRGHLRGRLHNADTGETYNLFRNAGGVIRQDKDTLIIDAGVPARSATAKLWIRIECTSHRIEVQSADVTLGERLEWSITVKKSTMPMFIQRLGKVYWF